MDEDHIAVQLLDGRTVGIRPIAASDGEALVRFHEGLTHETARLRFFTLHPHLTPLEVERFTHVDHRDREALVAIDGSDLIAVARFDRVPDTNAAEVAFVVADARQGQGLGTHLLEQLVIQARTHGIRYFNADALAENSRMLKVFRRSGLMSSSSREAGVVHVQLNLEPEPIGPGAGVR